MGIWFSSMHILFLCFIPALGGRRLEVHCYGNWSFVPMDICVGLYLWYGGDYLPSAEPLRLHQADRYPHFENCQKKARTFEDGHGRGCIAEAWVRSDHLAIDQKCAADPVRQCRTKLKCVYQLESQHTPNHLQSLIPHPQWKFVNKFACLPAELHHKRSVWEWTEQTNTVSEAQQFVSGQFSNRIIPNS